MIYFTCECGVECADGPALTAHLNKVVDTDGLCWRAVERWVRAHIRNCRGNRQSIDYTTHVLVRVMKELYGKGS